MDTLLYFYLPMTVVGFFFMLGTLGTFLPILPASLFVWMGVLIHKLWVPDHSISWTFFWVITGLAIASQVIDWICTYWGARKFGASWRGGLGALLGIIIGPIVLTPIIGIVIGPVIGAIIGELLGGSQFRAAGKAGVGTIVGGLLAFVFKLGIVCFIMVAFFKSVIAS